MSKGDGNSGKAFQLPIRVYYADTDAGGIVYHARYLDMAERCRTELLRHFGWPLVGPEGENFIVRRAQIDWQAPARLDDLITCSTVAENVKGARIDLIQTFSKGDAVLCDVRVQLVYVSAQMRPLRLPKALRAEFEGLSG